MTKTLVDVNVPALISLISARRSFAAYLDAEKALGRVVPDADTEAVALALVATVRQPRWADREGGSDPPGPVPRVVATLAADVLPDLAEG